MDMSTTAALCIVLLVSLVSYIVSSSIILLSFKPSNTSKIRQRQIMNLLFGSMSFGIL